MQGLHILPLEDLVDFEKEKERLNKEKDKLTKELARSRGMLSNEKFLNNAKPEKVQEEKDKLAKYEQMMETEYMETMRYVRDHRHITGVVHGYVLQREQTMYHSFTT